MTAINPEDESFPRICIYVLALTIAFVCCCVLVMTLVSCNIEESKKVVKDILKRDEVEIKHIFAEDLEDVAKEVDKDYQKPIKDPTQKAN